MDEYMLTTVDNPFDPYTQFESWNQYDQQKGYHSLAFLARVSKTSHNLSEADEDFAIQSAIDEIVRENVLGIYRKVKRGDFKPQRVET